MSVKMTGRLLGLPREHVWLCRTRRVDVRRGRVGNMSSACASTVSQMSRLVWQGRCENDEAAFATPRARLPAMRLNFSAFKTPAQGPTLAVGAGCRPDRWPTEGAPTQSRGSGERGELIGEELLAAAWRRGRWPWMTLSRPAYEREVAAGPRGQCGPFRDLRDTTIGPFSSPSWNAKMYSPRSGCRRTW